MSLTMISVTSCSVESTYLLMAVHLTDSMPMVSGTIETDPACAALAFERPYSATLVRIGRTLQSFPPSKRSGRLSTHSAFQHDGLRPLFFTGTLPKPWGRLLRKGYPL